MAELKQSGYQIGGSNRDRIRSDCWNFEDANCFKLCKNLKNIKQISCSKTINWTENLTPQLIISTFSLEKSVVRQLYTSKRSESERFHHPGACKLCFQNNK